MDRIQRLFQAQAAAGGAGPAAPDAPVVDTGELVYISSSTRTRIEPVRAHVPAPAPAPRAPPSPLSAARRAATRGSHRLAIRALQWRCLRCSSTGGRVCPWR